MRTREILLLKLFYAAKDGGWAFDINNPQFSIEDEFTGHPIEVITHWDIPRVPQPAIATVLNTWGPEVRLRMAVEAKLVALEQLRIKKAEGGLTFANKRIPTDKAALVLLQSAQMFLAKNPGKKFKKAGLGEFNAATIGSLLVAIGDMQLPIYAHESDLYDQIMACTTVAEIEAIDITVGWPEA